MEHTVVGQYDELDSAADVAVAQRSLQFCLAELDEIHHVRRDLRLRHKQRE